MQHIHEPEADDRCGVCGEIADSPHSAHDSNDLAASLAKATVAAYRGGFNRSQLATIVAVALAKEGSR
jgi:hypothetical protein